MKSNALILILILGLFSGDAIAQTGCLRNSNGQLYRTKSGSYYTTNSPVSNPHSKYCLRLSTTSPCYIKSGSNYYEGKLVTYTAPIGCPIDNYIFMLLGITMLGGYVQIRKRFSQSIS